MAVTGGTIDVEVENSAGTQSYEISNGTEWTYSMQTLMNESINSERGRVGGAITSRPAFQAGDLLIEDGDDGSHLMASCSGPTGRVTVRLRDGNAITLTECHLVGEVDFNGRTKVVTVRFEGRENRYV
ncbi:MAG: hypothetical protein AAF360_00110 [Pseudomonadota bacterium]